MDALTLVETRKLAKALGLPVGSRSKAQLQADIRGIRGADLNSLTVAQLKAALAILGKSHGGNKATLIARLQTAIGVGAGAPAVATPAPAAKKYAAGLLVGVAVLAVLLFLVLALTKPAPATPVATPTVAPATAEASAEAPSATPSATVTVAVTPTVAPSAGPGCALLGNIGSVCFPREMDQMDPDSGYGIPYRIPVSEGGYTIVALGVGLLDGQPVSPVAETVGHIVVIPGTIADGATPSDLNRGVTLTNYIPGAVAVTNIVTPDTPALVAGREHAIGMASPPNCGAEGCRKAYLWSWDWNLNELLFVEVLDLTKK